ncbi:MAG TPA: hypothetical protein DD435_10315 [Cyanobacteria bacterium UBA8530]|nr:hypothetical protein [Cyanobacteria bacterium UBA8530]
MSRILLLISNRENRHLLRRLLSSRYEVLEWESIEALEQPFDLCIVDAPLLAANQDRVLSRRAAEKNVFLPFLLLTLRQDLMPAAHQLWKTVDELIFMPIEMIALQARVEIALRTRKLSLELKAAHDTVELRARDLERMVSERTKELDRMLVALEQRARELERQRDFAQKIIDATPAGIAYLNQDFVYQWVNPTQARFFQIPVEDLIGHSIFEALGPGTEDQIGPLLVKVLKTGQPHFGETFPFVITREGHERITYWDFTYQPIFHESGQVEGILILAVEVSERVEKERLQRRQVESLQQADRIKDEFLSVISHELRTPLNAVIGFGSLLEDEAFGPLTPEQLDPVRKILRGADHMLLLIDDLLDFARMQAGKFGITVNDTDYPYLVDETVDSFQLTARQKKLKLEKEVEIPVPVCLDRRRIQQVISNLLANAIKFTPEGGLIRIRAFIEDGRVVTEVSDNGIGISPEELPKLFHPFKQLDMGLTRRAGGVGLGLSISKAIVEAHGGSIEARSEVGKGSTFLFKIPAACANPKES